MHCLRRLCQAATTKLDWEVVALSALSIAFGLCISEATRAAPDKAELRFRGTNGRAGLHRPKMGPWARKWGDFLARLRALSEHHPHRPAFFTSKAHLAAAFLELVQSPGYTCKTICWHSWRRFRAAQLRALGLPLHLVQIWGVGSRQQWPGCTLHPPPPQLDMRQRWAHARAQIAQQPAGVVRGPLAIHRRIQRMGPHRIASGPHPRQIFLGQLTFTGPKEATRERHHYTGVCPMISPICFVI